MSSLTHFSQIIKIPEEMTNDKITVPDWLRKKRDIEMNHKKEKSKIWLILSFLFFVVVVIAAGTLFKQYIDHQEANGQFDSLQASVNNAVDINTKDIGEVYAKESTQEEIQKADAENAANAGIQKAGAENGINAGIQSTYTNNDTQEEIGQVDTENNAGEGGTDADTLAESGIKIPKKDLDWNALHEQNSDIYAWIYVPGTTVDYPVVQHPTDNSYYLNHNMDGTKGFPGCIYTENFNRKDFSDIHTVIYGHNLKDKTMFSSLHNFENKELFLKDNYIYIYTQDSVFVYQIFAAYEFSAIHLLDNYDYSNEYVYEDYLKQIYRTTDHVANVREDINVTTGDKIITLSTCTADHDASRRFLVTGVLVNPRE